MKNYTEIWKELAHTKHITSTDVFQHCILRAMSSKRENKVESALYFLRRAFTPITNTNKLENGRYPFSAASEASTRAYYHDWTFKVIESLRLDLRRVLETEEERMVYNNLCRDITYELSCQYDKELENKFYTYVIVNRELLSKEQIAVQGMHSTINLAKVYFAFEGEHLPDNLNLVLLNSENEETLEGDREYIQSCGYNTSSFYEPDLNNALTAVASFPVPAKKKAFMKRYRLINFKREERDALNKQGKRLHEMIEEVSDLSNIRLDNY